jgi:hypothetical protein
LAFTFVLIVNARPQDYDDYEQQTSRPAARNQQQQKPQQQQQQSPKSRADDDRETTTWIPIIEYSKDQKVDGSYKTQ